MCGPDCYEVGPPPNNILSMPPPPLPSFLLPQSTIVTLPTNETQPCFAAFVCDQAPGPREQLGIEYINIPEKGLNEWLPILILSCIGVLLIGTLLAIIVLKCRDSFKNYGYQDPSMIKQLPPQRQSMCGGSGGGGGVGAGSGNDDVEDSTQHVQHTPIKSHHKFLNGGTTLLYPTSCNGTMTQNTQNAMMIQQQLANDSRMLWATLTPQGTRHYITDKYSNPDDHYEIIDYVNSKQIRPDTATNKRTPIKSFDNNGFIDYDYEDPTPLIDSYNTDDMDSGYQEPHEILGGTLSRCSPRPFVSSPTRIENPNIPPLNMHPHSHQRNGTMNNKKATLSRRISDTSSFGS